MTGKQDKTNPNGFVSVSPLLEKRCGSLDCHGNIARPMRIYGEAGLRYAPILDCVGPNGAGKACDFSDTSKAEQDGAYPGFDGKAKGTTPQELAQNWHAVCALEPEQMTQVTAGTADPASLLILTKPLGYPAGKEDDEGGERHKGGKVLLKGDDGYCCIWSWLVSAATAASAPASSCVIDKPGDLDLQSCKAALTDF